MDAFLVAIQSVWTDSGYVALNMGNITMIVVGLILLYLAIGKGYEPLLLTPIAFGCVLANFPIMVSTKVLCGLLVKVFRWKFSHHLSF